MGCYSCPECTSPGIIFTRRPVVCDAANAITDFGFVDNKVLHITSAYLRLYIDMVGANLFDRTARYVSA